MRDLIKTDFYKNENESGIFSYSKVMAYVFCFDKTDIDSFRKCQESANLLKNIEESSNVPIDQQTLKFFVSCQNDDLLEQGEEELLPSFEIIQEAVENFKFQSEEKLLFFTSALNGINVKEVAS